MNERTKKILLILAFVLVVAGFFFAIWYFFFKPGLPVPTTNQSGKITNGLPNAQNGNANRVANQNINALPTVNGSTTSTASTIARGGSTVVTTVTTDQAVGATVNGTNGNLQYYDKQTGQFFSVSPDGGTQTLLTTDTYPSAQSVTWAPSGNQAILAFPDNSKILYDFTTKKQTTMPSELTDFSFSPQSDQIASKFLDASNSENQWLVVSKPDGTQSQTAEHLGANAGDVVVNWSPNNQIIATYPKSINGDQQEILFLGANSENFQSVDVNGRGFTPNWSPDGTKLLYSIYSPLTNDNPHLYMMSGSPDSLGNNMVDVGLDTSADKCAYAPSGVSIYCAVPYYYNPGSGPQPSLSAGVPDNIYKVDLRSGAVTMIARPVDAQGNQRFSATNLQVSTNESVLYFTDATTGTVQQVRLK